MKLYYSPGVCSLSPHIILREAGITPELIRVDLKSHKTEDAKDFYAINPKGYVPALELDDGRLLTEGVAINLYLADKNPKAGLAPAAGSKEYYEMLQYLIFISTELHKSFYPIFYDLGTQARDAYRAKAEKNLAFIAKQLGNKPYLMGEKFSLPDAYLFTVLNWANKVKLDLSSSPNLAAYSARVAARPAVQAAMKAEGLLEAKAA